MITEKLSRREMLSLGARTSDPEWIQFLDIVSGRAMHLKYSGEDFWRVDSP